MYTYDSSHTDMKLQVVTAEIMKKCPLLFGMAILRANKHHVDSV